MPAVRGKNQSPLLRSSDEDCSRVAEEAKFIAVLSSLVPTDQLVFVLGIYADIAQSVWPCILAVFIVVNVLPAPSKL